MDTVGPLELLIIGLVLVAVFGSSRLPGMARNLGRGLREFRSALREADPIPDEDAASGAAEVADEQSKGRSAAPPGWQDPGDRNRGMSMRELPDG
jgi:sec-independent protein translocase protein TatA